MFKYLSRRHGYLEAVLLPRNVRMKWAKHLSRLSFEM